MKLKFFILLLLINFSFLFANLYNFSDFEKFIKETRSIEESKKIAKLLKQEEFHKVIKLFEETIDLNRNNVFLDYFYLGDLYSKVKIDREAIDAYKKSIYLNDSFELAYYKLANKKHCSYEAIDLLEKAISLNPKFEDAYYNLGYIYATCIIDYKKAEENFIKLLEINNNDYESYYQLSSIYLSQNKKEKGISFSNKAIELKKDYFYPYILLYNVYLEEGNIEKANNYLSNIVNILEEKEKDLKTVSSLAKIYMHKKDYDKASKMYSSLLNEKLNKYLSYEVNRDLSFIYREKNNFTFAIKYLEEIRTNQYFNNYDIINLSDLYLLTEKSYKVKYLLSSIKENNLYFDNYNISLLYFNIEEWEKSKYFALKALDAKSYSFEAYFLYIFSFIMSFFD